MPNQILGRKDGLIAADLEIKFEEMNGWNAESDASNMLCDSGIPQKTTIN